MRLAGGAASANTVEGVHSEKRRRDRQVVYIVTYDRDSSCPCTIKQKDMPAAEYSSCHERVQHGRKRPHPWPERVDHAKAGDIVRLDEMGVHGRFRAFPCQQERQKRQEEEKEMERGKYGAYRNLEAPGCRLPRSRQSLPRSRCRAVH